MRRFIRTLLLALDALLAALFLAGYLAYYVRPTVFWWFELIAIFLPYITLVVGLVGGGLLLASRWRLAALHGVLLLLVVIRSNPFDRFTGEGGGAPSDTMAVLTYNVPRWWGYEMPAKTTEMSAFIREAAPDVIGLQEASIEYHPDSPRVRAAPYIAVLFDSLGFHTRGPENGRVTYTLQPVLSRYDVLSQEEFQLRRSPEDKSQTYVTRARIRWRGREFVLYNVHLRTFGEKKPWHEERLPFLEPRNLIPYLRQYREVYRVRAWEIEEIVKMVEREELPVVLCGDLNSTPYNWVHGRISDVLRDAYEEGGTGWGMTYHTRLPVVRIDYIFVSEDWDVVSARVVDAGLSDHLPLLVRLRLRE